MPTRLPRLDLSTFDGKLLDGLDFCGRVYDLFDQVRSEPDGVEKLRLLRTKREKRLIEELLPIARYVQTRYREGRRIKVRWFAGSQPFDAVLWSSGGLVKHHQAPKRLSVEVTTSVHQDEYLSRQLVNERGVSFGPKTIRREKKTGEIISEPYVYRNNERAVDLARQIIERIKSKSSKKYSPNTVLIVNCITDGLVLEPEWNDAIEQVKNAQVHHIFREVFLIERLMFYSASLYSRSRKSK